MGGREGEKDRECVSVRDVRVRVRDRRRASCVRWSKSEQAKFIKSMPDDPGPGFFFMDHFFRADRYMPKRLSNMVFSFWLPGIFRETSSTPHS